MKSVKVNGFIHNEIASIVHRHLISPDKNEIYKQKIKKVKLK